MAHGVNDVTIPIDSVRLLVPQDNVVLYELEGNDHSLASVKDAQGPYSLFTLLNEATAKKSTKTSAKQAPKSDRGNMLAEIRKFRIE